VSAADCLKFQPIHWTAVLPPRGDSILARRNANFGCVLDRDAVVAGASNSSRRAAHRIAGTRTSFECESA